MAGGASTWWYRLEHTRRLNDVPLETAQAAQRLGFSGSSTSETDERKYGRALLIGVVLVLVVLQDIPESCYYGRHLSAGGEAAARAPAVSRNTLLVLLLFVAGAVLAVMAISSGVHHVLYRSAAGLVQEACRWWRVVERVLCAHNDFATLLGLLVFLSACDRVLLQGQWLYSLYTLFFCIEITFCITYAAELYVRVGGPTSTIRHLATTNIVLECIKAVNFITFVLVLIILALEKRLQIYTPSVPYMVLAALYWGASEETCRQWIMEWLGNHRFEWFDTLEEAYLPLLLEALKLSLVGTLTVLCFLLGHFDRALAGAAVIRIQFLQLRRQYHALAQQLAALAQFRPASAAELSLLNDSCAICLYELATARVTPCHHYYHAGCLLKIVTTSGSSSDLPQCPLCKTELQLSNIPSDSSHD